MGILKIANYIFSFYFLNVTFKNNYPEIYNNILIKISYFGIYCFSKVQMKVLQTQRFISAKYNNFLLTYPSIKKNIQNISEYLINTHDVEYIINGEVEDTTSKKWLLNNYKKIEPYNNTNKISIYTNGIYKKVFPFIPFEESQFECNRTNYKFILTELRINNKIQKIDFVTNEYNYMVIGNIINTNFIIYFLKTHYPEFVKNIIDDYGNDLNKYKIRILDHQVNEIILSQYNYLTLNKDDYKISLIKDVNY